MEDIISEKKDLDEGSSSCSNTIVAVNCQQNNSRLDSEQAKMEAAATAKALDLHLECLSQSALSLMSGSMR